MKAPNGWPGAIIMINHQMKSIKSHRCEVGSRCDDFESSDIVVSVLLSCIHSSSFMILEEKYSSADEHKGRY